MSKRAEEEAFAAAVRASGRPMDLSAPYMREDESGFDSPFTAHAFFGWMLRAAQEPATPAREVGAESLSAQILALPRPGRDRCWRPRDAFDAGFRAGLEDAAKLVELSQRKATKDQE